MPRLFTGIEIPLEVVQALSAMRGGVFGARWVSPEDYHLTLRFIGDVDGRTADSVAEILDDIRRPSTPIEFGRLDWFGGDKPRAIVARIKPAAALINLQLAQERGLRRLGLPPETRNYSPHVTLARLRAVPPAAVADYLGARADLTAPAFEANRFVLFSSRDSVGGGPYVVEAAYPLGEADEPR
jgi:2'-5' RNA ligase